MKIVATSLCIGFLILGPSLAAAGWQYTTWGMSPDQVVKASSGAARPPTAPDKVENESTELLRAPYMAGEYNFDARFFFSNAENSLVLINLELRDPSQCSSLWGSLVSRYGTPLDETEIEGVLEFRTWRDTENGNFVAVTKLGGNPPLKCSLQYKDLLDEKSGL